jgi:DNA-binding PadR family transcriptional regulator
MAARKVGNLLGLAVLAVLAERPMHRYEMASVIRSRGKDRQLAVKWGSLYTVVDNLARHGFIAVVGTDRDGARPERTIYRITEAGVGELQDWAAQLLAEPGGAADPLVAGLSVLPALSPETAIDLLGRRVDALAEQAADVRSQLVRDAQHVPRMFLIEDEYALAQLDAQLAWVRGLRDELATGTFPDLAEWRRLQAAGMPGLDAPGPHDDEEAQP